MTDDNCGSVEGALDQRLGRVPDDRRPIQWLQEFVRVPVSAARPCGRQDTPDCRGRSVNRFGNVDGRRVGNFVSAMLFQARRSNYIDGLTGRQR